jgi:hypothetical protein
MHITNGHAPGPMLDQKRVTAKIPIKSGNFSLARRSIVYGVKF